MLDQNSTIILSSAITVIGTLGGAIAGVVLSNHHSTKLESLKIEQERSKRKTEVIEEVYSLLIKIDNHAMDNISKGRFTTDGLTNEMGRVKALVHLYLPSAITPIDRFLTAIDVLGNLIIGRQEYSDDEKREISTMFKKYHACLDAANEELEKLVR